MRVKIWSAAVCLAALTVGHAPISAQASSAPSAKPPTDLRSLRAKVHQLRTERHDGSTPGAARSRFVIAPLTRSSDADAPRALAVGPPEQLTVGPAISRAYVQWQPPSVTGVDPVTSYRVYRGSSTTNLTFIGTTTGTAILNRGLAVAKTYYYAVAAVTQAGEGERSAAVGVTIPRAELIFSVPTTEGSALVAQARRGAPLVPIFDDGHHNFEPAVSPNGKWLAYVSDINGRLGVYVRRADGSGTGRLAHSDELVQPSWSPDGKWLIATQLSSGSSYAVRVSPGSTSLPFAQPFESGSWTAGSSVVGVNGRTGALVEEQLSFDRRSTVKANANALDGDVSPDGEWVAYSQIDGVEHGFPVTSVRLVSRRGGQSVVLAAPGGVKTDIAWSRRGSHVFFTHFGFSSDGAMEQQVIFSVKRDGSGLVVVSPAGMESFGPAHREVLAPPRATAPKPPTVLPDFNGDGGHDLGVFRPSNGTWYVRGLFTVKFGRRGDVPVPADFNGDGKSEVAVWRPSTGMWHIRGMRDVEWGRRTDIPVPADYNGDGRDDIAVWRPSTGRWHIRGVKDVQWGRKGDIPFAGIWRFDTGVEPTVWRPSTGTWYINRSGGHANQTIRFGRAGDVPVRSAANSIDDRHNLGIFRPSTGTYYELSPRHPNERLIRHTFGGPAEVFAAVPLGVVWHKEDSHTWLGDYGLFQPATGAWSTVTLGSFVYGRRGDLPL